MVHVLRTYKQLRGRRSSSSHSSVSTGTPTHIIGRAWGSRPPGFPIFGKHLDPKARRMCGGRGPAHTQITAKKHRSNHAAAFPRISALSPRWQHRMGIRSPGAPSHRNSQQGAITRTAADARENNSSPGSSGGHRHHPRGRNPVGRLPLKPPFP